MFFTKKKFDEALEKEKNAINEQWERKFAEYDKSYWRDYETNRTREDIARRFDELSRRVHELEKTLGVAKEEPVCPYAPKCASY